jgi:DNA-binding XRE family transcriptional regulator
MKPRYTIDEFNNSNSTTKLKCECYSCKQLFYVKKKYITHYLKLGEKSPNKNKFCSEICSNNYKQNKIDVVCAYCNITFQKTKSQISRSKTGNQFCSKSCAAQYNNTHKTTGNRRSKLENYLECELIKLFPNLEISFNNKTIINSELDIYIPSLKLAFELNGIFHYEPIYGNNKLLQIQNNDNRKFHECLEQGIGLCIIDTSQQKYFKEQTSEKYLNIIINIIKERMLNL